MLVCDELGNCYDDGTGTGSLGVDSGNPCDTSSVAYDPVACANLQGGYGPQGGTSGDSGDPCDPTSVAYDPAACAGVPGTGYLADVPADVVAWCETNAGACDAAGPTAPYFSQFCQDVPAYCGQFTDGTVGVVTTSGGLRRPGTGGAGSILPGSGALVPGGTGAGGNFLSQLGSFFNGLFMTCPVGYIKTANGQCVRSGTTPTGVQGAGLLQGQIGGVSIGTIAIIVIVLIVLSRKK